MPSRFIVFLIPRLPGYHYRTGKFLGFYAGWKCQIIFADQNSGRSVTKHVTIVWKIFSNICFLGLPRLCANTLQLNPAFKPSCRNEPDVYAALWVKSKYYQLRPHGDTTFGTRTTITPPFFNSGLIVLKSLAPSFGLKCSKKSIKTTRSNIILYRLRTINIGRHQLS